MFFIVLSSGKVNRVHFPSKLRKHETHINLCMNTLKSSSCETGDIRAADLNHFFLCHEEELLTKWHNYIAVPTKCTFLVQVILAVSAGIWKFNSAKCSSITVIISEMRALFSQTEEDSCLIDEPSGFKHRSKSHSREMNSLLKFAVSKSTLLFLNVIFYIWTPAATVSKRSVSTQNTGETQSSRTSGVSWSIRFCGDKTS